MFEFDKDINTIISELKVSEDNIFWVENYINGDRSIKKFDINTKQIEEVRNNTQSHSTMPICLVLDGVYLSWYENETYNENEQFKLCIYNTYTGVFEIINSNVCLFTPYDRAHIRENIITFVLLEEEQYNIVVYDLEKGLSIREITLSEENIILNPVSNSSYTIWHNGYGDAKIFIYENKTKEILFLDCNSIDASLFSLVFIDDLIFINDRMSNDILELDLNSFIMTNVSKNVVHNQSNKFVLTDKSYDGNFIAINYVQGELYIFRIIL